MDGFSPYIDGELLSLTSTGLPMFTESKTCFPRSLGDNQWTTCLFVRGATYPFIHTLHIYVSIMAIHEPFSHLIVSRMLQRLRRDSLDLRRSGFCRESSNHRKGRLSTSSIDLGWGTCFPSCNDYSSPNNGFNGCNSADIVVNADMNAVIFNDSCLCLRKGSE